MCIPLISARGVVHLVELPVIQDVAGGAALDFILEARARVTDLVVVDREVLAVDVEVDEARLVRDLAGAARWDV